MVFNIEVIDEILVINRLVIHIMGFVNAINQVKHDVSYYSQKVRDQEQNNDKPECLESSVDPESSHDRGVVMSVVLCHLGILYSFFQLILEEDGS